MSREQFTTTIEKDIQLKFKKKCKDNNYNMNDILETFMEYYNNDKFIIKKETKFSLETNK